MQESGNTHVKATRKPSLKTILATVMLAMLLTAPVRALEQAEDGEFEFKKTLPILGDQLHTSCMLHSGYNLTMIHCSDQFEVYDTQTLED